MKIRDWFKFVLFSVTPHLVFDEIGYLFSRVDEGLRAKPRMGTMPISFWHATMPTWAIMR